MRFFESSLALRCSIRKEPILENLFNGRPTWITLSCPPLLWRIQGHIRALIHLPGKLICNEQATVDAGGKKKKKTLKFMQTQHDGLR